MATISVKNSNVKITQVIFLYLLFERMKVVDIGLIENSKPRDKKEI